jgi:hypothetical protein
MKAIKYSIYKRLFVTLAISFVSVPFFGQTVFDKFEGQDDIASVIVNKKMFSLLSKMEVKDKETQQYVDLIKNLDHLKVFITTNDKKSNEMKSVADKYQKSAALDELMRINDKGKNVKIYAKTVAGVSQINEMLMFIEGSGKEESVLMSITGNFDLNELSVLTDKMKLPGGEDLKKAAKNKKP